MNRDKLQTIIDTLEANGAVETMVAYFEKKVAFHREAVRQAEQAIESHTRTRDLHTGYMNENQALAEAFGALKEEESHEEI